MTVSDTAAPRLGGRTRLLYLGPFITMFDRFAIAPLLLPIARDFHEPLAAVAGVATFYFLLYGVMQVVYGVLSDRIGRVRLMRLACLGVFAAGLVSTLAPTLPVLIAGRALTGAIICSIVPTSFVYVGDTFPFRVRQQVIADLLVAVALGSAAATFGAGLIAQYLSWRLAFVVPAVLALVLAFALRWLPESLAEPATAGPLRRLRALRDRRWLLFLIPVALVEGAAMLGFFTFLAPALEAHGTSAGTAGAVVGFYGVAVLAGTQVVKRLSGLVPPHGLILIGGGCLVVGFVLAALDQGVAAILVASALCGAAYAVMHSTFQTWSTEIAPEARGTAVALFATSAFLGAGLGTAALAGLAGAHQFSRLFWVAAAISAPVTAVGAAGRWRFGGSAEAGAPGSAA